MHPRYQATKFGRWIVVGASLALVFAMRAGPVQAAATETLSGCDANTLVANDDESTGAVDLGFSANFFGKTYTSAYINNNGNVTFGSATGAFSPQPLDSAGLPIIAPFWADVDTTGAGSGVVTYGQATFGGRPALCVNWDGAGVGYFAGNTDKLNKFQLLLVGRADLGADNFDVFFNYDQIQWETGDADGGTYGLGGSSARAGYSNGSPETPVTYELPGSAVNGAFLDSNTDSGLIHNSNVGLPGRYIYPVRGGTTTPDDASGFATGTGSTTVQTTPDGIAFSILTVPTGVSGAVTMQEVTDPFCALPSPGICIGQRLDLTAPGASAATPLVLKILVAKNAVNARLSIRNAVMLHEGVAIARCGKMAKATANPDPCLSSVKGVKIGGVAYWQYLVYTSSNGSWRPGIIPR